MRRRFANFPANIFHEELRGTVPQRAMYVQQGMIDSYTQELSYLIARANASETQLACEISKGV